MDSLRSSSASNFSVDDFSSPGSDDDEMQDSDIGDLDDDMDFDGDGPASEPIKKESNYTVLTKEQMLKEQTDQINRISELFEVPPATARQLLTYMKWNVDRLIDRYYGGEAEQIFKDGGIADPNRVQKKKSKSKSTIEECSICMTEYPISEFISLPCDHLFCGDCWRQYLHVQIMSEGKSRAISCMAKGCKMQVDEVTMQKLVSDTKILDRYAQLCAEAYVQDNPNVRWCPGKGCNRIVRVQLLKDKEVVCECGTKFCFGCGRMPHAPSDCKMVSGWSRKCELEGENSKWMAKFTKECPKCGFLIHKEGGCQYMGCTNCSHKFCWICLGAFDHKNHACNKFKEDGDKNSKRAELNKFMHFYTRYMTHEQSIQLEDKLMAIAEKTMEQLAESGVAWIDVQYIKKATLQLMEARNMLKWTYVYGYYLPDSVNRDLFEWLQSDLEAETEKLSGLLEAKGDKDKQKIINATDYVGKRIKNLLEGLAEGEITGGAKSERVYAAQEHEKYEGWIYNAGN